MLTARLAAGILVTLVLAALAIWIGRRFLANPGAGDPGRAIRRYGIWWVFLGVDAIINQATWLAGALGLDFPWLVAILTYAALASIGVMLWGLASYVLYLFTGKPSVFRRVTIFYAAQVLLAAPLIIYLQPNGVNLKGWSGEVAYVIPPPAWAGLLVAVFFLLPPIVAAIAYGTLFFRTRERATRRRIATVSLGIVAWFAGTLILGATGAKGDVGPLVGTALSAACMTAMAMAYSQWPLRPAPRDDESLAALKERILQLV